MNLKKLIKLLDAKIKAQPPTMLIGEEFQSINHSNIGRSVVTIAWWINWEIFESNRGKQNELLDNLLNKHLGNVKLATFTWKYSSFSYMCLSAQRAWN